MSETGKIEYAPDYKSDLDRRATRYMRRLADQGVIGAEQMLAAKEQAEHERLRSAVVEAAKEWRAREEDPKTLWVVSNEALITKVDELLAFEASHAIGQKDGE